MSLKGKPDRSIYDCGLLVYRFDNRQPLKSNYHHYQSISPNLIHIYIAIATTIIERPNKKQTNKINRTPMKMEIENSFAFSLITNNKKNEQSSNWNQHKNNMRLYSCS